MQSRSVRHPSVCKLFCANPFFYHRHGRIPSKLTHDGPHTGLHPGCAQGQGQRSRDTDTFLITRKSLHLPQSWLDRHQTCTRWSPQGPASRVCLRSRSRVTRSRDTDTFLTTRKLLLLPQTWLDRHQTCKRWSPHGPASRVCSRSKVSWYGHFCDFRKIAYSHRQMTGSWPNLHMMIPSLACIQDVLKVKVNVKDHVIRTLLWFHENRFFS